VVEDHKRTDEKQRRGGFLPVLAVARQIADDAHSDDNGLPAYVDAEALIDACLQHATGGDDYDGFELDGAWRFTGGGAPYADNPKGVYARILLDDEVTPDTLRQRMVEDSEPWLQQVRAAVSRREPEEHEERRTDAWHE